ncbi:MAG: hypothetical protein ACT4O0_19885 [Pseudonocardia sp.]
MVSDGGSRVRVYELGADCAVGAVRTAPLDPDDVEDLARGADGTLWLADTGDNGRDRDTVAMLTLDPTGRVARYGLRYPDGPHDVEAVLLGPDRTPLLVTKELFGPAAVYRPERALEPAVAGQVLALTRVAEVELPVSDTTGGPIGGFGSRTITGGATSVDGAVIALRTYTDAWLYPVSGGDLVGALGREPVRVPLPGEPQGEAIAFDGAGGLLSASERRAGEFGRLRLVPGAAGLVSAAPATPAVRAAGEQVPGAVRPRWWHDRGIAELAALGALTVTTLLAALVGGRRVLAARRAVRAGGRSGSDGRARAVRRRGPRGLRASAGPPPPGPARLRRRRRSAGTPGCSAAATRGRRDV